MGTGSGLRSGPSCTKTLAEVTQDWLDEFVRVQWLLRLSPR
jgi:hypothetical protein